MDDKYDSQMIEKASELSARECNVHLFFSLEEQETIFSLRDLIDTLTKMRKSLGEFPDRTSDIEKV